MLRITVLQSAKAPHALKDGIVAKLQWMLTIATLTLMLTVRAMVELIIDLACVFAAKPEVASDLLQGSAIFDHHIKAFKSIRPVFFFKLPLELVGRLDMKFVPPVRDRRGSYIE